MTDELSRESLTPTNELYNNSNENNVHVDDIVEIKGPEIDLCNISDGMGVIDDITGDKTDNGDDGQERTVEAETDLDGNPVETRRDGREDGSRWAEDVKEMNDDIVEGMIEEGIRQVTQDGFIDLEEDTVQYPSHMSPNRFVFCSTSS
jgi:hypothetical protein